MNDDKLIKDLVPDDSDDNQSISVIKEDSLIDLKVSTGYYRRLQLLLYSILDGKSAKEIKEAVQQIRNQEIKDDWIYHYETMIILCKEIETKAEEQGHLEETTVGDLKKKLKLDDTQ